MAEIIHVVLYKYMGLNGISAFLQNPAMKLSFGHEANDRFEMLPGNIAPSSSVSERSKSVTKHGFISLTRLKDNPYLWGYYGDAYKGACIELSFYCEAVDEKFSLLKRCDRKESQYFSKGEIDYKVFNGENIVLCEYEHNRLDKVERTLKKCTHNIISNKHMSWSQEQEYRIIYSIYDHNEQISDKVNLYIGSNGSIFTTKDLNACITKITLGPFCPISNEEAKLALSQYELFDGVSISRGHFIPGSYRVATGDYRSNKYCTGTDDEQISLMLAAKYGDIKTIKTKALDKGILEQRDNRQKTVIDWALRGRYVNCIESLLSHKFCLDNLNATNDDIIWASRAGSKFILEKMLLKKNKNELEKALSYKDKYGRTALMWACQGGYVECVRIICESLTNLSKYKVHKIVNLKDLEGRTALLLAAWKTSLPILKILINNHASLNATDFEGASALIMASSGSFIDDAKTATFLKYILKRSKSIPYTEKSGRTALMYAANSGKWKCLELLIANMPQRNHILLKKDNQGNTALMYAYKRFDRATHINKLEYKNADEELASFMFNLTNSTPHYLTSELFMRVKNYCDRTKDYEKWNNCLNSCVQSGKMNALMWSALFDKKILIRNIIESLGERSGLAINNEDSIGCTAPMWSVAKDNESCLREFFNISFCDVINHQDKGGCTLLMWIARKGSTECAKLFFTNHLLSKTLFIKQLMWQDNEGLTPLMWAAWKGKLKILKLIAKQFTIFELSERQILKILNCKDSNYETALDWASRSKSSDCVKFLASHGAIFGKPDFK